MIPMKEKVLLGIYEEYEQWATKDVACTKGCSACCTQNVLITAVEGDLIHRFVREQEKIEWFAGRLLKKAATRRPAMTTNGFATSCFEGVDVEPESYGSSEPCPFLEKDCCTIYEARPFSCRCFASTRTCGPGVPAEIEESHLSGSTAVMQVIEHLCQGEYFGNMLDVLLALSDLPENRECMKLLPASISDQGRAQIVKSLPLPGFLLLEEEMEKVEPLLQAIFNHMVDGKRIEDILNNR